MNKILDLVSVRLKEIESRVVVAAERLNKWNLRNARFLRMGEYEYLDADWRQIDVGDIWARQGQTAFMQRAVTIPADWAGKRVGLEMRTGGEGLLRVNGAPFHGVDDNRGYILLTPAALGGESYDCEIEIKTGGFLEYGCQDASIPSVLSEARLLAIDRELEEAYFDFKVIVESAAAEDDLVLREKIAQAVNSALAEVDFRDKTSLDFKTAIIQARKPLWQNLEAIDAGDKGSGFLVGHSHIDVAWLWPLAETMRKVGRTYSTVSALMDEFPDYHFVCSQVPLFLYLKQNFPEVYERVKERVAEGRFEPVGGSWVENDCNLVSGESLVRQCLYGQRFFREEFGVNVRVGWLPDVFGYSWSLPQVYKKSGLDYFMTAKLTSGTRHKPSHNTFWWQGIDGSRILSHFILCGYNAMVQPHEMKYFWKEYESKLTSPEFLCSYGWGDGGGGPNRQMLEFIPRIGRVPGQPRIRTGRAHDYFDGVVESTQGVDLPIWNGEIYYENHRGTYTSQARNKRDNRKSELIYRDAELWSSFAGFFGLDYPMASITEGWHEILLSQFHDILPGSSISEVYKDTAEQYPAILENGMRLRESAVNRIAESMDTSGEGIPVVVFNSLEWSRSDCVTVELASNSNVTVIGPDGEPAPSQVSHGKLTFLAQDVPACGCAVYRIVDGASLSKSPFTVDAGRIETPFHSIEIADDGTLTRIYDKTSSREVLPKDSRANVLQIFEDKAPIEDGWNIEGYYEDRVWEFECASRPRVIENGPSRLVLGSQWRYGSSSIDQQIIFYPHTARIDFVNHADWHERKTMLKVAFPVDVLSPNATYEIAYGAIERPTHRNTSWDQEKFEVSGHKWADLSETGYGVSILNDCKYGWDIKDNVMRLTLLRSPEYPDPNADEGEHCFTYSLFPHGGDWTQGTVRAGCELNVSTVPLITNAHPGTLGRSHSFLAVKPRNVVVSALKRAEDDGDLIIRVYEAHGSRGPATITFDRPISRVLECNLLEEPEEDESGVQCDGESLSFNIKPFEIHTFKVTFRGAS